MDLGLSEAEFWEWTTLPRLTRLIRRHHEKVRQGYSDTYGQLMALYTNSKLAKGAKPVSAQDFYPSPKRMSAAVQKAEDDLERERQIAWFRKMTPAKLHEA